jgi:hypothetical protein
VILRIQRPILWGSVAKFSKKSNNTIPLRGHLHSFGRGDQLDVAGLKRLIGSLSRFMSPEDAQAIEAEGQGLKFESSYPAGGALIIRELWKRIGIDECLTNTGKR